MSNVGRILDEKTRGIITESLMMGDLSFSELLRKTSLRDHGQLNYHLKSMIDSGLVKKNNKNYALTEKGERMGVYINQFQSKEMYPVSVVCAIIPNSEGNFLFLRRAKNPQKGKWSFPGGKVALGEKISEAAEREVFEETGIKSKFDKVAGFFPSIFYKNNQLSFHANIIAVLMKPLDKKIEISLNTNEHDEFAFVSLSEASNYELIANNLSILAKISKRDFVFEEVVFNE